MRYSAFFRKILRRLRFRLVLQEMLWIAAVVVAGIFIGLVAVYSVGVFSDREIGRPVLTEATILYDRTGTHELYRIYDEANREIVAHDDIPDSVRYASVASEDERFYSHYGIDPEAIIRAFVVNIRSQKIEQGASTITQQLARSLFLTRDQTWKRKIEEVFLSLGIESRYTKDEILDLYLNTVPYGSNAYGIETAAQTFFSKSARELNLEESALLAALPNAPTLYSPYGSGRTALVERQKNILRKMHALDFITQEELDRALTQDILGAITPPTRNIFAPHFVFHTVEELEKEFGDSLPTAGLRVITTLDYDLQTEAETIVKTGAERNKSRGAENAALVAVAAETGEILVMVGSKDYFDSSIDGEVNITTSLRQPGSSFKPIAYAAAFEKGFEPETPIFDVPIDFGPDGRGERYVPNNYDGRFSGKLTMRQALARSLNIPAVTTLALTGLQPTIEFATRLGITTLTDPSRYGLSLVLGGAEVRPLDMASAFAVFGREGKQISPTAVLKIEQNGAVLPSPEERESRQVIEPEIARKINSVLSDNQARAATFGTSSPLAFPRGVAVAAKTGTTQDFRDAWTVGYTPHIAVAVWVGNNDNRAMTPGADGVYVAAPIWRSFMNTTLERFPESTFTDYQKATVSDIGQPRLGYLAQEIHYFDRKSGREITEAEARDLKDARLKRISSVDLLLEQSEDAARADANGRPLVSIEAIKKLYEPAPTNRR